MQYSALLLKLLQYLNGLSAVKGGPPRTVAASVWLPAKSCFTRPTRGFKWAK